MEAVKAFNAELCSLYDLKPPVSKAKMNQITKTAMKAIKFYKHVVQSVEKFIQKCRPEYKVPGLYVVDSIIRQSRRQFGPEKDVFATRFSKNIVITFTNLFACPAEDLAKIIRVLNLWQKNGVYSASIVKPLLDLSSDAHSQTVFERVQKEIESVTGLAPSMPLTRCDQKPPALTADALQLGTSLDTKPNSHTDILKVVAQMLQPAPAASQPVLSPQAIQLQLLQQLLMQQMQMIQEPTPQPVIDSSMLSQLQDLTQQLLGSTTGEKLDPPSSDQGDLAEQLFDKKLLEFDYGDSEEEGERRNAGIQSTWRERMENSGEIPETQSNVVSEHLEVRSASRGRAGRSSDELDSTFSCGGGDLKDSSAADPEDNGDNGDDRCSGGDAEAEDEGREHAWKGNDVSGRCEHRVESAQQSDSDEEQSEAKDAEEEEEDDEKSQSSYVRLSNNRRRLKYDGNDDESSSENNHSTSSQRVMRKDQRRQETQKRYSSDDDDNDDCIIVDSDSSDGYTSQRQKKRMRLSRNRSASRSRSRTPSCSRSRSASKERQRKSKNKDRKRRGSNSETAEESLEKQKAKKERDRKNRGLPPLKENHISICSTTVWIGHLNKQTTEDDLQEELCKYGEATINLIPPRGCAFVCFNTRKEASKALEMLKGIKLLGNALKVAWAPGVGIKESAFRKLCNIELGVTYIPWEKAPDNLEPLLDGGVLDEDSVPKDFAVRSEQKEIVEEMEVSRDSNGTHENKVHQQSEITSSEKKTTTNSSSNSIPEMIPLPPVPPPIAPHLLMSVPLLQPLGLSPLQSMPVPPIAPFSQQLFLLQQQQHPPSSNLESTTREPSVPPEFAIVSGMPTAPGLPPADGMTSSTSSDGKALAPEVKVKYENTADWSESWQTPRSDDFKQHTTPILSSTAASGQVSNAVFSMAQAQNTSDCPLPAFSHHPAVCSVVPSVAVGAGISDPGPNQPLGSFSGGLLAFDPTKPPPGLFGEQNEKQKSDDVLGNWSSKPNQDCAENESACENMDDFPPREISGNDGNWNKGGCNTSTNLDVDRRNFPPFPNSGSSFESNPAFNSTSAASIQASQPQIFSPGNDLEQIPSSAAGRSHGNGAVRQDEMHWMSQNNRPQLNLNLPNSASSSSLLSFAAHVMASNSTISLNKATPQFSHQGLPFNGGTVHPSFAKQEKSVDRSRDSLPNNNNPSIDLRFPSSAIQSMFGSGGGPSFLGAAGQGFRSGLERPPAPNFPSSTRQTFEQRLPYAGSHPHNLGMPRLSGLDNGVRHQLPLGGRGGRFSPDLRTEPLGVIQKISDIPPPQRFPFLAQAQGGMLSGPRNIDSPGCMPNTGNMDGPGRMPNAGNMGGPGNMDDSGRMPNAGNMGGPRNMDGSGRMPNAGNIGNPGNMGGPRNMSDPGYMSGPVRMGGPGNMDGPRHMLGQGNMDGPGHMRVPGNMGGTGNMGALGPANISGSGNMNGPVRMPGPVNMSGPCNMDGPGRMPGPANMGGPGNMDGPGHMPGTVNMDGPGHMPGTINMGGPGNMSSPWHMSSPVNMGGPGNMDGPGRMPGPVNMGGPGNVGGPVRMHGSGNAGGPRDLPGPVNIGSPGYMPGQGIIPDPRNPGGPGGGSVNQWSSPRLQDPHPAGWSSRDQTLPNRFMKAQPLGQHPNPLQSPKVFASRFESNAGDQQKFPPTSVASMGPRFGEPHFTTNESRQFMHSSVDQRPPASVFQQNDVKAFVPRPENPHFPDVSGHPSSAPWQNQTPGGMPNCPLNPGTFNPNRNDSRPQLLQTSRPSDPPFFRPQMIPNSPSVPESSGANAGFRPDFNNMPFMRNPSNEMTQTSFPYTTNHNRPATEDRQNPFELNAPRIQRRQNDLASQSGLFNNVDKREHYSASNLSNSFTMGVGKNDADWKSRNTDRTLPM